MSFIETGLLLPLEHKYTYKYIHCQVHKDYLYITICIDRAAI